MSPRLLFVVMLLPLAFGGFNLNPSHIAATIATNDTTEATGTTPASGQVDIIIFTATVTTTPDEVLSPSATMANGTVQLINNAMAVNATEMTQELSRQMAEMQDNDNKTKTEEAAKAAEEAKTMAGCWMGVVAWILLFFILCVVLTVAVACGVHYYKYELRR